MEEPNTIPLTPLAGDSDASLIPVEKLIRVLRGQQIMVDSDLAHTIVWRRNTCSKSSSKA